MSEEEPLGKQYVRADCPKDKLEFKFFLFFQAPSSVSKS